jgi:DNA repair protein RecN (Recombination protein N)
MLRELHISNLAVIADARIELAPGLNGFTGATGAGKSLVLGALEMLLGLRGGAEMLRPGADEGRVSGLFDLHDPAILSEIERATDIPVSADGGELLITRRLYASGRGSVSLNGQPITLGMLKAASEMLVDVHGQHDHQFLLKPANQLQLLDQFGQLDKPRGEYQAVYQKLQAIRQRLQELSTNQALRDQQLELYRFQAAEIDAAEVQPGEYEELSARASVLGNLEKLKKEAGATHAALYEIDGAVLERLKGMAAVLGELAELDQSLDPISKSLRDATLNLEETAFDLSRYLGRLDLDPGELAEVNDRLNTLNRLMSKYGDTTEEVLAHRQEIGRKIAELERAGDDLSALQKELDPLSAKVNELGRALSHQRRAAAEKLSPLIETQLAELGMEKAKFTIAFADSQAPAPTGFDTIEFIAQTNPGQLAQPLRKIASGGELSRIMLALKGILAGGGRVSVLVFDEIDANVGGRLGAVIGKKLRALADHHQVLCITHLPQIAGYADRHLTVRKTVVGDQTQTTVRVMEGEERIEELAEMIGGHRITDVTRAQARELLEAAKEKPKRRRAKAS